MEDDLVPRVQATVEAANEAGIDLDQMVDDEMRPRKKKKSNETANEGDDEMQVVSMFHFIMEEAMGTFEVDEKKKRQIEEDLRSHKWIFDSLLGPTLVGKGRTEEIQRLTRYGALGETKEEDWDGEVEDTRWVDDERDGGLRVRSRIVQR